jgi:hypothetical protein
MTPTPPVTPARAGEMDPAALARLGITRVTTEQFHIGAYRYARLADAIAQAKRVPAADNDS